MLHCGLKLGPCLTGADMIDVTCLFCLIISSSDESDLMFSESDYEL